MRERRFHLRPAEGVELIAHDLGGDGPIGLFAHATGFPLLSYAPLLGRLGDRLHLIGPDLRGHAGSSWPWRDGAADVPPADWQGFADDLAATLAALAPRPRPAVIGIGHSSGASALVLAEVARPGTFAALYCYEPAFFPAIDPAVEALIAARTAGALRRRSHFSSRAAARERLRGGPLSGLHPESLEGYLDSGFVRGDDASLLLALRPQWEAAIYASARQAGARLATAQVACPVRVVCGGQTDALARRGAEGLAAQLATAELELIDGLAHLGPLERPAEVAASLLAFLAAVRVDDTPSA
ncbi:MAG: alpha/beta hydrolase [Actinomycetota bacterium]|nr:alpha/beta hydrolase [Actinomycetota bacterium]